MRVWRLEGVAAPPDPTFPDDNTVLIPVHFSTLQVKGKFRIQTECANIGPFGMELGRLQRSVQGTVTETYSSSSLTLHLDIKGKMKLASVSVEGTPKVDTKIDSEMPDWLIAIGNSGASASTSLGPSVMRW